MVEQRMVSFPRIELAAQPFHEQPIITEMQWYDAVKTQEIHKFQIETIIEDLDDLRNYIYSSHGVNNPILVHLFVSGHNGDIIMQWD